jgi:signal transduction histidine kinase
MADHKRRLRRSHRLGKLRPRRTRLAAIALGAGVVMVLVFALVFSIAFGTRQVAAHADALHNADEALRASTVIRAQTGMATHLSVLEREFGFAATEGIELAIGESSLALNDLEVSLGELESEVGGLDARLTAAEASFAATVRSIHEFVLAGESLLAQAEASMLDEQFRELTGAIVVERDYQASQVATANQTMGRVGDLVRFLVAFLVPTAVILLYRELSQRQARQSELEVRLESEQELGKARDEFVANASHELRTPLTSIFGLAHILEEDPEIAASETAPEMVGMIISETHDLSRMVDDLLTTARLDAGALHFQLEDLSVLDEVREVVEPMAKAGPDYGVDVHPAVVRADRLRLRQVIRNLLSNATKYGGADIRVVGRVASGWYELIVADNGDGIPAELEDRLFQRFLHQGDMPLVLGSVGLGLSIVQALAEGMGGAVWYERDAGWTKFVVRVPMAKSKTQSRFREADLTRKRATLGTPGGVSETPPIPVGTPAAAPAAAPVAAPAVASPPPAPGTAHAAAEQLRRMAAERKA